MVTSYPSINDPDQTCNWAERTSFWSRVEFQADNTQLVCSTGANVSVMVLQGYKSTPRKADHLSLATEDMVCEQLDQIASYVYLNLGYS